MDSPLSPMMTRPLTYNNAKQPSGPEYSSSKASIHISRKKGGLTMESRLIKVRIDSYQARNSICPTAMESIRQYAQLGRTAAAQATENYAKEGALLLDPNVENSLDQIITQRAYMPTGEFELKFLPETAPLIEWIKPELSIRYVRDELSFEPVLPRTTPMDVYA